jgi:amphi-Trp domain-containing protein
MTRPLEDREFEHRSHQDAESVVRYLEALVQGFRNGRLLFCAGTEELLLYPRGLLEVEVEAARESGKGRLEIEVEWREPTEEQSQRPPLEIRAPGGEDEG